MSTPFAPQRPVPPRPGMSTRTKIGIGAGGCAGLGCLSFLGLMTLGLIGSIIAPVEPSPSPTAMQPFTATASAAPATAAPMTAAPTEAPSPTALPTAPEVTVAVTTPAPAPEPTTPPAEPMPTTPAPEPTTAAPEPAKKPAEPMPTTSAPEPAPTAKAPKATKTEAPEPAPEPQPTTAASSGSDRPVGFSSGGDGSGAEKKSSKGRYANCTEAREAGAAPLHRGDPGYAKKLDRDGDGVACEN